MYDPAHPPEWLSASPSDEEMQMRRDLREVFAAIDEEPEGPRFFEFWEIARTAEGDLARLVQLRVERAMSTLDDDFSDIDLAEPGALGLPSAPEIRDASSPTSSNNR
jgi:hypothetical protein